MNQACKNPACTQKNFQTHLLIFVEAYFEAIFTSKTFHTIPGHIMIPEISFFPNHFTTSLSQQTTGKGEHGHPVAALLSETVHLRLTVHNQLYSCTRERET